MSDKKLIAVIGDYGFTTYPLMVACLNSVIQHMGLDPKEVAIINSRCRGAETHAASYCLDELGNDPVGVEMPWGDMSEPCEIAYRADGKEYNKLAGVKRDVVILANPNLVGVVFLHQAKDVEHQLTLNSRFPKVVAGSRVPTYIFQLGARKRNGKRIETTLLPNQAIPDPILPHLHLKRGTFADKPWAARIRDNAIPEAPEVEVAVN
ncbi:hypothetical protein Voja6_00107 [Pseudomonas phage vB_PpuM-Voja-6]